MNKSFRFNEPELNWLSDLKELTGHSETDILRCALLSFHTRIHDPGEYELVREKYFEAVDYCNYKNLQKKVFT